MALPNDDPSNPGLPAPLFADVDAVRGDQLRANNQLAWENMEYTNDAENIRDATAATPADADLVGFWQTAGSVLKKVTMANFFLWIITKIYALTGKTTLADSDQFFITDSTASNVGKSLTWANLFLALVGKFYALTGKTTLADSDQFFITDSAASNVGKSLTYANLKAALTPTVLWVRDEKSSGTAAAALTASTWNKRELGTTTTNGISGATVTSSVISLPAGTYDVSAFAMLANLTTDSVGHQIRVYNTSDSALIAKGNSAWVSTGNTSATPSMITNGRFTIAATKNIELQHWTGGNNPGGKAVTTGSVECYAEIFFRKIP